jgi:hypothetical protein
MLSLHVDGKPDRLAAGQSVRWRGLDLIDPRYLKLLAAQASASADDNSAT